MHIKIHKIETNANEVKFSNEKLLLFYLIFAQIEIIEIYRQKGKRPIRVKFDSNS